MLSMTSEETATQRVASAIQRHRRAIRPKLTQEGLSERLTTTSTPIARSTLAQIERLQATTGVRTPHLTQNRIINIAACLEIPLDDLASPDDLATFPVGKIKGRGKRTVPTGYVDQPHKVVKRILAYGRQHSAYDISAIAYKLRRVGYPYSRTVIYRIFNKDQHLLTDDLVKAIADVYSEPGKPFPVIRLLSCTDHEYKCPCCFPDFE